MNLIGKNYILKRTVPILSSDSSINPTFYNWNKIHLNYCDGRGFVGYNLDPIEFNGKKMYFRGFNNTQATLNYLKNNLAKTDYSLTSIIISGVSAGGLASLYYSNFIADYFRSNN